MRKVIRGFFLHFLDARRYDSLEALEDGAMIIDAGRIVEFGPWATLQNSLEDTDTIITYGPEKRIMPGMIDTHIHYPQMEMIAAWGDQLLDWLEKYTFPTEIKYAELDYAEQAASLFIQECLRNGTTSAAVFCSSAATSCEAFFSASQLWNTRMIAGKVMMDRNAPEALLDDAASSYADSQALIERWHGQGRQLYAITPRFAPTSTPRQLELAGRLKAEYPSLYVQSHISENVEEIAWVKRLFPDQNGYLDVYDHFGLLSDKTILAHGVHLTDSELAVLVDRRTHIAFCPTSNLFLGSGLLDMGRLLDAGVSLSLATDVGAGSSFSQFQTMQSAYGIGQLNHCSLTPLHAFHMVTLGNASQLGLDHLIGNFETGKEADFVVLDLAATPLIEYRMGFCNSLEEQLFVMMILGDDRLIEQTWVMGERVHDKHQSGYQVVPTAQKSPLMEPQERHGANLFI